MKDLKINIEKMVEVIDSSFHPMRKDKNDE